jgi:putative lipoprotein
MSPTARASDPDPWFGRDKALHFSLSAAIAGTTYAIAATQFDARYPPLLVGGGVALAAGAAKETADMFGYGQPSWKDFTWDVIGTVVGLGIAWGLDLAIRGVSHRHPAFGAPEPTNVLRARPLGLLAW